MFNYNKFWHFWFDLDNRYYARAFGRTLLVAIVSSVLFFPALWATPLVAVVAVIIPSLLINGCMWALTKVSDFIYKRQNEHLKQLEQSSDDEVLKEQLNLFINRRTVCPEALLLGQTIDLSEPACDSQETYGPLMLAQDVELMMVERAGMLNRNPSFVDTKNGLFMKQAAPMDVLSEVAAQDMADLVGLAGIIPKSTLSKAPDSMSNLRSDEGMIHSREAIRHLIARENSDEARAENRKVRNLPKTQDAVGKFIFNLKAASYKTQAKEGRLSKLQLHQSLVPHAKDGNQWVQELLNEPMPGQFQLFGSDSDVRATQRGQAKALLEGIDQRSFEDNFILQIILGSQDSNPGNTLFVTDAHTQKTRLHSIDHERIMPENNYNMTKLMPLINGGLESMSERPIKNVFPMRIWLAGLPQADIPFSKATMEELLKTLNPERLIEYHRSKKLFTPAAVGAQVERVQVIRRAFEAACKQDKVTLTPKALFGMFVNNHPSYGFLKDTLGLSDLSTYMLLGQIPEDAEVSLFRHPLQFFQILSRVSEISANEQREVARQVNEIGQGRAPNPLEAIKPFSDENFATSFAPRAMFFRQAFTQKAIIEKVNKPGLDIIEESSGLLQERASSNMDM
ncbi:MAG: hypothetical protein P1U36_00225 [Legionellaceae bacterium]|nr:hypothetical protein [Legionellaceae bacterium]